MFDISFGELALIGLVALVVLGPERLPKVARTLGHLMGRLQRYVSDVKADINREMQLEELKKLQQQMTQSAREMETSFSSQMQDMEAGLKSETAEVSKLLHTPTVTLPEGSDLDNATVAATQPAAPSPESTASTPSVPKA